MATIVLVDPPGWQGSARGNQPYPNVGIAYLAAVLARHGHEVAVHDRNNEVLSDQDLVELVEARRPLWVGFSAKTRRSAGPGAPPGP